MSYSLVVFIVGVAFSISHAIVSGEDGEIIKYSTEVNNICIIYRKKKIDLNLISDLFCMFILDIYNMDDILYC